jgi:hypothetical protein
MTPSHAAQPIGPEVGRRNLGQGLIVPQGVATYLRASGVVEGQPDGAAQ